jgi:dienelactone hydrolase
VDIYQSVVSPILFSGLKTDPEWLQKQTISNLYKLDKSKNIVAQGVKAQLAQSLSFSHDSLTQKLWGLEFSNPVGLAAGFDKDGLAAGIWSHFGFGFAEIGTVTMRSQPGNPQPRLFRLPIDKAALNRMGFNNCGAAAMAAQLADRFKTTKSSIPLGINLGKSKVTPLEDFVRIAAQSKALGCPAKFWFTGYSLGGQLALWAVKAAQELTKNKEISLDNAEIGGAAVICPSLDSIRSLNYLVKDPWGKYLEQAIAKELKKLVLKIYHAHPGKIDLAAIGRANSIWGFDKELVIDRLGFPTVEAYYEASSGLHILPHLEKPTLILYAADDPMFAWAIIPDLQAACQKNPHIDLLLTNYGGHVGYISSREGQKMAADPDCWWAWNRILEWCDRA